MNVRDAIFAIWQRLPVRWRRSAAHGIFAMIAPRPTPVPSTYRAGKSVPVIIVGFLSSPSGLGQSARLAARALIDQGHNVYGIDLSRYFHEVADTIPHDLPDGKTVAGSAHVILNINAPYLPYALFLLGRSFLKGKHLTGYWAWELQQLPATWKKGFSCVHDIAAPSSFVAGAIAAFDKSRNVHVIAHPAALDLPPVSTFVIGAKQHKHPFTIINTMSIASGFERKNPLALIAAFKLAFGTRSDVRLRMLVTNANHYPPARDIILQAVDGSANIEVSWQSLSREELWHWWGSPDVYASLHRSEGFGLPMAEAMCAGYPVVATGWSGNMDFMTDKNSFPVDYSLTEINDPQEKYAAGMGKWAEADITHAARIFQRLKEQPELAKAIASKAQMISNSILSSEQFSRQILALQLDATKQKRLNRVDTTGAVP